MRRRIFLWMGLGVLFAVLGLSGEGLAKQTYQVRQGDTLQSISEKVGVTPEALKKANRLKGTTLKPKQVLTIPDSKAKKISKTKPSTSTPSRSDVYRVKKGDNLVRVAKKTGIPASELRELNHLKGNALKTGQVLMLKKKAGSPKEAADPAEITRLTVNPDLEEEEGDGGIANEEAWAEIERRKKENEALLGNWSNPDEPKLLVKVAMGFLGAPYRLGGSTVTGIDCSGFVKKIYQVFNITLPRTAFEQSHVGLVVSRSELVEGDLIFFNTRRALGHVGIYIGNNEFVHASSRKRGVRVDNLSMPYFNKRFVRAVRLKGSDEVQ